MTVTFTPATDKQLAYPRRRYGGQRRGSWTSYRCTHEDYPCCGCGPDAGR